MTMWREMTLGDAITLQRGFDLTRSAAVPGPYPVISSGGPSYTTDVRKVEGPGVITGRKGVLGKVHFSKGPYWPHDTTLWVKDFKGSNPRYIYYLLQVLPLASLDAGASNPTLNRNHAHPLPVRIPVLSVQDRVSSMLGGLDDLIENNRRRIELLDRMAQAVYREWFVNFRYPGHENHLLTESTLGCIPTGWTVAPVGSLATLDRTSVKPANYPDETFDHYSIPAYDHNRRPAADNGIDIRSSKYLLDDPAVLVSKLNPRIERTWLYERLSARRSVASTEFLVLRPRSDYSLEFIYCLVRSESIQQRMRELSGGTSTSHQRIKPRDFLATQVALAPSRIRDEFCATVVPVLRMASVLRSECEQLAAIRDLLLPRLVTGEIDVSKLDLDGATESVA